MVRNVRGRRTESSNSVRQILIHTKWLFCEWSHNPKQWEREVSWITYTHCHTVCEAVGGPRRFVSNSNTAYTGIWGGDTSKLAELWPLMKRSIDYPAGNWPDVCWESKYRHCEYFLFWIRIKVLRRPVCVRLSSFDAKHRATIINGTGNKIDSTGIQLCIRPE